MTNRFVDLERDLFAKRAPAKKKNSVNVKTASAPAPRLVKSGPLARSFRQEVKAPAIDYTVPGLFDALQQPSNMTCWATVATMLIEWRKQKGSAIGDTLDSIDKKWGDKFRANLGLQSSEKTSFLSQAGLAWESPMSPSIQGWLSMLQNYGPLWVTTDELPGAGFAIHARVLNGIHGDGTPAGTTVDLIDPASGTRVVERFDAFQAKFEEEAATSAGPLRIQIVHWPDARFGIAESFSGNVARKS